MNHTSERSRVQQEEPRRVKHTSRRCNQEDQLKSPRLGLQYSWEEEERAPQEKGKMLKASCLLCRFSRTSGSTNIPFCDLECDVYIAHVVEVGGQRRKTTIAADD